jgi:GNAT superfamily N-acetyltransferase
MADAATTSQTSDMTRTQRTGLPVTVRLISEGEAAQLRVLRLRALADAPAAFEITLREEELAPAEHWIEWARRGAAGQMSCTFVAIEGEHWCGMAGGFLQREGSQLQATLFAMWVAPDHRGRGVGGQLVEAVVEWARLRGAQRVQLWVTDNNEAARALYARHDFVTTGQTQPLPSDPTLREEQMARGLR